MKRKEREGMERMIMRGEADRKRERVGQREKESRRMKEREMSRNITFSIRISGIYPVLQ